MLALVPYADDPWRLVFAAPALLRAQVPPQYLASPAGQSAELSAKTGTVSPSWFQVQDIGCGRQHLRRHCLSAALSGASSLPRTGGSPSSSRSRWWESGSP